ncbi:hypothetical protein KUTeg_007698 [Tegillarca granosa]|uniref:Fucosyltransferase n=1 Tax=Tegillarca granosa TaxID=220873 RepID=A0ABQ9FDZ1_TEGGR|nr:hypothetical protein KUTeg_007698 [Tegillarca granosa]
MDCRTLRSANVLANWRGSDGNILIQPDSFGLKPCKIDFYFSHVLDLDGTSIRHFFAKVTWYKEYVERTKYGNNMQIWHYKKYSSVHGSCFVPVQRIRCRFTYGLTGQSNDLMMVSAIPRKVYNYITEKVLHLLVYTIIPVVRGEPTAELFLPPGSYIDTKTFQSATKLGKYLKKLQYNESEYIKYFNWRNYYRTFHTPTRGICSFCKMLHTADDHRCLYNDIDGWVNNPAVYALKTMKFKEFSKKENQFSHMKSKPKSCIYMGT